MSFKKILFTFFLIFSSSAVADDKMALGLDVYNNKAQCGVCHTLQAASSTGDIGPNFDLLRSTIPQIIFIVIMGLGMSLIMTLAITYINTGMYSGFINRWLKALMVGFPIAIIASAIVTPIAKKLTKKITSKL